MGRPVVLKQFGWEGKETTGNAAGSIAVDGCGGKTGVTSGVVEERGVGGAAETVGGAWSEAVAVLVVAVEEDGEEAAGKPLHFY